MKKLMSLIIGCFVAIVSFAQYATVNIKVTGNKNKQVLLDGRSYSPTNAKASGNSTITVTDLQPGQHTIQVIRNNRTSTNVPTTTFTLRQGYDVIIVITGNGAVQVKEKRNSANNSTGVITRPAMTDAEFSGLLKSVQNKWFNNSKATAVSNAFANTNYYFTTAQAMQLIQSVTGGATRLQLAKASYSRIVDQANFNNMYSLFTDQASINELAAHTGINNNNNTYGTKTPVSAANFSRLLQDVQSQWQAGAKYNLISSAFAGGVYFTSSQARQLIQQIDAESSRLQLAKESYATISDINNFNLVYELLSSQASRNELASFIRQRGGDVVSSYSETYRTPMTDANFNLVLDEVRRQWLPGSKMTALRQILANTTNYFSVAQVRQLVGFVSSESNRLELLRSAYRNTTDRNNYTTLYDLLSSQSAKDELSVYISSYRE